MLVALDMIERENGPPLFVEPFAGNNVASGEFSLGPRVVYDAVTGDVTAFVPAPVLKYNDGYWNAYTLGAASFTSSLLGNKLPSYSAKVLEWQFVPSGLVEISPFADLFIADDLITWRLRKPVPGRPEAAVLSFERPLPAGLNLAELTQRAGLPDANYVDFYNHREIVTLRVPFAIEIVPEPGAMAVVVVALTSVCLRRCR